MASLPACLINSRHIIRFGVFIVFAFFHIACKKEKYDTIIRQATIYDGSGQVAFIGDVAISGDTISIVGDLSKAEAQIVIDGKDLALPPGFIDTHIHHD